MPLLVLVTETEFRRAESTFSSTAGFDCRVAPRAEDDSLRRGRPARRACGGRRLGRVSRAPLHHARAGRSDRAIRRRLRQHRPGPCDGRRRPLHQHAGRAPAVGGRADPDDDGRGGAARAAGRDGICRAAAGPRARAWSSKARPWRSSAAARSRRRLLESRRGASACAWSATRAPCASRRRFSPGRRPTSPRRCAAPISSACTFRRVQRTRISSTSAVSRSSSPRPG